MPTLYIIQGFIGSGKTTFSKLLADNTNAERLNADEWVEQNFTIEEQHANWDTCFSKAISTLWNRAEDLLSAGTDVVLDFGFWTRDSRNYARKKAAYCNAKLVHFYLDVPDEILLERLKKRSGLIAKQNIENFSMLKKEFHKPDDSEVPIVVPNDGKLNIHPFLLT